MKCNECLKEKCEKCGIEIINLPVCQNHEWKPRYETKYIQYYYYDIYSASFQPHTVFIGEFCNKCGVKR